MERCPPSAASGRYGFADAVILQLDPAVVRVILYRKYLCLHVQSVSTDRQRFLYEYALLLLIRFHPPPSILNLLSDG